MARKQSWTNVLESVDQIISYILNMVLVIVSAPCMSLEQLPNEVELELVTYHLLVRRSSDVLVFKTKIREADLGVVGSLMARVRLLSLPLLF